MTFEYRKVLHSKIHRATVTDANLDYEGSVTIPLDLMEAADLFEHEAVQLWNVTRGTRVETYVLKGARHSGEICVNGAAAHLFQKGDCIIIAHFCSIPREAVPEYKPIVLFVDGQNRIKEVRGESAQNNSLASVASLV